MVSGSELSSFKAPWLSTTAKTSLTSTGLYEAGANVLWLDPGLTCAASATILSSEIGWQSLSELVSLFSMTGGGPGGVSPGAKTRIVFPGMLEGFSTAVSELTLPHFDSAIRLLGGHPLVHAWYIAVCQALLENSDAADQHLRLLWQCGLTVTVRVLVLQDVASVMTESMCYSERLKVQERSLTDNFVTFLHKLNALLAAKNLKLGLSHETIKEVTQLRLQYNGAALNRTMLAAAAAIDAVMTPAAQSMLVRLELEYGRDLFSSSYNKLQRLAASAKAAASSNSASSTLTSSDIFLWSLESVYASLSRGLCSPKFYTVDNIDKQKDHSAGWASMTSAKCQLLNVITNTVMDLRSVDEKVSGALMAEVLPLFATPMAFVEAFPGSAGEPASEDAQCPEEGSAVADTKLAEIKEGRSKGVHALIDVLYNLHDGSYDRPLRWAASNCTAGVAVGTFIRDSEDTNLGDLAKDIREAFRLLSVGSQTAVVAASAGAPPPPSLRVLARIQSDPEAMGGSVEHIQQERAAVWAKAQAQRRKLIQLIRCPRTKDNLTQAFDKATSVRAFRGTLKEAHRMFVVSADLVHEVTDSPWGGATVPATKPAELGTLVEWALDQQVGPADFVLAFDGRHRDNRRELDTKMSRKQHTVELWVLYKMEQRNAGEGQLHALTAWNREVCFVSLPAARNRLETKERAASEFAACGETTTFYTSYSGVPLQSTRGLPKIAAAEKSKIFPDVAPGKDATVTAAGVPLFWGEGKSSTFWSSILHDFDIASVCDLTPGSGQLAEACLQKGCQYVGMVASEVHLSWLQNVLDRQTLKHLVCSGRPLYQQDLATSIQEHFADVLEQLNEPDGYDDENGGE